MQIFDLLEWCNYSLLAMAVGILSIVSALFAPRLQVQLVPQPLHAMYMYMYVYIHALNLGAQVIKQAGLDEWQVTPALVDIVRQRFTTIGCTIVNEDAFRQGRPSEQDGGNQDKVMRPARFFDNLPIGGFIGQRHGYKELEWQSVVVPLGEKYKNTVALFATSLRAASAPLKGCPGPAQKPPWCSPAPVSQFQQDADMELAMHCQQHNCWEKAGNHWPCLFLRHHNFMVRHIGHDGSALGGWSFVVGDIQGVAALLWPAVEFEVGGTKYYMLGGEHHVDPMPLGFILDMQEWQGMRVDFQSPLALACHAAAAGVPAPSTQGKAVLALPQHRPMPLLHAVAMRAFGETHKSGLFQLAKHIKALWGRGDGQLDLLQSLLRLIFPLLAGEALLDITGCRVKQLTALGSFVFSGEADEALNKENKKSVQQLEAKHTSGDTERKEYAKAAYRAAATRERTAREKAAKNKRKRRVDEEQPAQARTVKLDGFVTAGDLNGMLPPSCRVWYDRFNSRWQLVVVQKRTKNWSFNAHGVQGAARALLKYAWSLNEAYEGEAMPFSIEAAHAASSSNA